ncbi:Heterokaryon incompatibility protein (HET) [Geosmithia morbida]|uniref:Heterokaryon incompatibility protein (HET) n=1 Tax=Geosmithia morbida TaxID=1094350 RepID=A0A9P4YRA1_9HYPO|nr:Heterokaryon incompatibility protein (HET) [Geosmithia morbida]KAF4121305.1 Heterokaryon incompatibility protein (HET) [Geosmithia morbida]
MGRSPHGDSSSNKRNSITSRLFGSLRGSRGDTSTASLDRRSSLVGSKSHTGGSGSGGKHHSSSGGNGSGSPVPRIREWLDACNREHDHHCATSSSAPDPGTFRPVWLIDSAERCLVRAKPANRYVALSYVWSASGAPTTTTAATALGTPATSAVSHHNRRRRSDDTSWLLVKDNVDVFEDALPEDDLPQTVIDAMWLARKVGLRYLWVDKICVVQDDAQEVEAHIAGAAYIFANAYLTVVAAHGTIHDGLAPIRPRRPASQSATPPSKGAHDNLVRQSKWSTRCWTLEEGIYSRRRVYFFEEAVTWQCHCDTWEGTPTRHPRGSSRRDTCTSTLSDAIFAYRHAPWPDLDEYARIAMDYSARRVTSVEDTVRAFSSVTNVLSRIFPGGFLYGMPLMFLDIALLWRPQASIRRRAVANRPFLPSWSWMGWWFDGVAVDLTLWRAAADYLLDTAAERAGKSAGSTGGKRLQSNIMFRVKPTIRWAVSNRTTHVPVDSSGLRYRELRSRRNAGATLPPGWERSGGSSYFTHDSEETTRFKYPIPVEDPPEDGDYPSVPNEVAMPGPLLAFRTDSAFFEVDYDATLSPRDADMNPSVAVGNIWSHKNRWAGSFRAHDGWLGVQSSNYEGDEALEFIAISTATERKGSHVFNEAQYKANVGPDELVDIVNVLWIERIGDMAYRRGLGHILQKAWDDQTKEEDVEILLG